MRVGEQRRDKSPEDRQARRRCRLRERGGAGARGHTGARRRGTDDDRDAAAQHPARSRAPAGCGMSTGRAVLTVSELTRRLQEVLEDRFPAVWVEGEISNFRLYGSGHAYFTLKDADSQIRAVLFRNRGRRIKFEPADGLHVMAFGSIEVYPQRGEYEMVIELLEPKGLGALQLAFEQLKARLQAEGLFEPARKRELPRFPRKIGVVTSTSGAAIRDMLRVIGRRFGELHIVIAPCRVQGEGAAEEIVQGLRDLKSEEHTAGIQ